jgi:hypothetical protein
MTATNPLPFNINNEETLLAEYISQEVTGRLSGRLDEECLFNAPRDVYFIGNLRARPTEPDQLADEPAFLLQLRNKLAPTAFGADFQLLPDTNLVSVRVKASWNCYYRVFPTLDQQREHQRRNESHADSHSSERDNSDNDSSPAADEQSELFNTNIEGDDVSSVLSEAENEQERLENESPEVNETTIDRRRSRVSRDSLFVRYRKIRCQADGRILLELGNSVWSVDDTELQAAFDDETERARQLAIADSDLVRASQNASDAINVPESALESQETYEAFLLTLNIPVSPVWRLTPEIRVTPEQGIPSQLRVEITLVNASPTQQLPPNAAGRRKDNPNIEAFLFDVWAGFAFEGAAVVPFELELAPRGFRYNRELWGRGFNCGIQKNSNGSFWTTHTPTFEQQRYSTQSTPSALFADLSTDPVPTLRAIEASMENYLGRWDEARNEYSSRNTDWNRDFGEQFDRDREQFENEILKFQQGLGFLISDVDVMLAFKLANETFRRAGINPHLPAIKHKTAWRLFQIVFLVSQIAGIVDLSLSNPSADERERVDIIYFPTGGGKTEAYLATLVFHCFYDRLRGKTAGVTAWTRFPLRLLTLQQTQRFADVIGIAEIVRREQKQEPRLVGDGIAGFAVGYYVGKEATPNEIVNPDRYQYANSENRVYWSRANDNEARQLWKRVIFCPACHTKSVQVDFDEASVRVLHRCTNSTCPFPGGRIPIYVVDNEIYRYLPTVIVGTIDKLASIGNQRKLAQVFGQVDGKCRTHGYYKGRCCQKDCTEASLLRPGVPRGLTGPTLFIQDELHLLKEGLGTFDGHYETFAQRLRVQFGQDKPLKIIASSATIEAFSRQARHLYGRTNAAVFPGLGPTLRESFYANTQSFPQRIFVGLLPHNKTLFNSLLELLEVFHRTVQNLQSIPPEGINPFGGSLLPGTPEWISLLDPYVTSLTYFLANRELDEIRTDIIGDVNPNLTRDGHTEINPVDMTGSTSTDEVTEILERLEQSKSVGEQADSVLATSMISHGVDIDRLNIMFFNGMPRQTAEYIQASSRVGRSHVGVVFTCLHPARERDQSHYTYFEKYHEFIGQMIEPVAINRWAKFSIRRTLPGLFMGILLQVLSNSTDAGASGGRYYLTDYIKQKITDGTITPELFIPFLEEAYLVSDAGTVAENDFREEISRRVQRYLDFIVNARSDVQWVSEALIPQPMASLRDVDEALEIELDDAGSRWAATRVR